MGQELVIPDSFKNGAPAKAFAGLNALDDNLSEGIGQSYAVLGYKGKQWSLRYRGERHNFLRPDDGTPASYIDVIILNQAKQKSKSFYKKFDPATSDGDRPICASIDGVRPDPDVTTKQCDTCVLCPRNEWKTDPVTGRKGRECTDYKRVAVLLLPSQTKLMLGQPLMEPVFLRVPPASLNSLAIMGDTMANQGFHYSTYITRISFDPNEAHPKMVFRPLQGLSDQEAPIILELRVDPIVNRITGGDVALPKITHEPEVTLAPAGTVNTGFVPSTAAASATSSTVQPSAQVNGSTNSASAQPATSNGTMAGLTVEPKTTSAGSTTQPPGTVAVDTGFGGVTTAGATPQPEPATQTVSDTGQPEDSDADLDARIAGLINTAQK